MKKHLLFFALAFIFIPKVNAQWLPQNSGTTNNLLSVHFVNDNVGYVTDGAYVRKTINGGANWNLASNFNFTNGSTEIFFTTADTGFVATTGIYKTTNGGITWKNNFKDSATQLVIGITFPSKNIGYAAAIDLSTFIDSVFIYKTTNAGDTWSLILIKLLGCGDIQFTDVNTGYATIDTSLYKTTNGGSSWNVVATNVGGYGMDFPTSNIGYSIGSSGYIAKTTTAGVGAWTPQFNSNAAPLYTLDFMNADTGFVAGGNGFSSGMILKTLDGGANWNLDFTSTETFASMHFPSQNVGYACASGGKIYKYTAPNAIEEYGQLSNFTVYPNPYTSSTTIQYSIQKKCEVTIEVINILGEKIATIIQTTQEAGEYSFPFSAKQYGFDAGLYFVKINVDGIVSTKKIIELK